LQFGRHSPSLGIVSGRGQQSYFSGLLVFGSVALDHVGLHGFPVFVAVHLHRSTQVKPSSPQSNRW